MGDEDAEAEERRLRRFNVAADTLRGCFFSSLVGGRLFKIALDDGARLALNVMFLLIGPDDEVSDRRFLKLFCLEAASFPGKLEALRREAG